MNKRFWLILAACNFILIFLIPAQLSAQTTFTSIFSSDGNTTGAKQNPLSLGNWGSPTSAPQYRFYTTDLGAQPLEINSTRWAGALSLTRDAPGGTVNLFYVGGWEGVGTSMHIYNANNETGIFFSGSGNSYFNSGNVGIGTTNATEKLTIAGHTKVSEGANFFLQASASNPNDPGDFVFQKADGTETSRIFTDPGGNGSFYFATGSSITPRMILTGDGNLGIGTTDPQGYRLAVNGDAIFTKVKVKPYNSWPDYVFQPAYRLLPLPEVEKFIQQNGHLPEVPSAAEVEKEGLDLGSGQAVLLKKIEELTLYIIQQQKEIEGLKLKCQVIDELKKEITLLKQSSED